MGMPEPSFSGELDAVFDQSTVPLAFLDAGLRVRRVNAACRRLSGLTDEAVIGRVPSEIDDGMDVALMERTLAEQVVKTGVPVADVPLVQTVAGKRKVLLWSADPVVEDGQVRGVLCRFRDVGQTTSLQQAHAQLERAGQQIGTTLDIYRTAGELADLAVPDFADLVVVDLLDEVLEGESPPGSGSAALHFRRVAVRDASEARTKIGFQVGDLTIVPCSSTAASELLGGRALLARNPAEIRERTPYTSSRVDALLARGVHCGLAVPLIARGVTLGAAVFWRAERPEPCGEADVRLASDIAARAAVSIDNARLYTREHATAITLQRSLLPRHVPRVAGLRIAHRYQPASQAVEVGGDWFDVIPLGNGQVALVVGDVTGHSIHAAATMGQLRTTTAALARLGTPPAQIMRQLNCVVSEHGEETGATCLFAQYDPATRRCRLTSAGHPPPALRYRDGTAEIIDIAGGVMLGVGASYYPTTDIDLDPGSVLALYTDGLIEHPGEDITTGLTRLARTLAASSGQSLEQLCDSVLASLGTSARDDIAMLFAQVL
jgi:PAS domain S-box-containing protein